MNDFVLSPNMNLPVPIQGVTSAPNYALYLDSSLNIIDGHSHTAGSGVLITPAAININAALTMNDNPLTFAAALTLQVQTTDAANQSVYMKGVDFYLRDGNGNVIRLTQSGSVTGAAGTITGLPSGTASASYGSGTFVFQSATATAANIDGGSILLRNNTANSYAVELSPISGLGSNYQLYLPTIPPQTEAMTLSSGGNMGTITYDQIGQAMSPTGANAIMSTFTAIPSSNADIIASAMGTTGANIIAGNITSSGANAIASEITSLGSNLILSVFTQILTTQANIIGGAMGSPGSNAIIAAAANPNFSGSSYVQVGGSDVVVMSSNNRNGLTIIRGIVSAGGSGIGGEGFTVSQPSTGVYNITFTNAFFDTPAVTFAVNDSGTIGYISSSSPNSIQIQTMLTPSNVLTSTTFNFIAIGLR